MLMESEAAFAENEDEWMAWLHRDDLPVTAAAFDPSKHPHRPKGAGGGQWARAAQVAAEAAAEGVTMDVTETDGVLKLNKIVSEHHGEGNASEALDELVEYADEAGKPVFLNPSSLGGLTQAELVAWYRRHGFVPVGKGMVHNLSAAAIAAVAPFLVAAAWDPSKHPRNPGSGRDNIESPGDGGKFKSAAGGEALSREETEDYYATENYELNTALADNDPSDLTPEQIRAAKSLDAHMEPLGRTQVLYRGGSASEGFDSSYADISGATVDRAGYISTADTEALAERFAQGNSEAGEDPVVLRITAGPEQPALRMDDKWFGADGNEIVLGRGTKIVVGELIGTTANGVPLYDATLSRIEPAKLPGKPFERPVGSAPAPKKAAKAPEPERKGLAKYRLTTSDIQVKAIEDEVKQKGTITGWDEKQKEYVEVPWTPELQADLDARKKDPRLKRYL